MFINLDGARIFFDTVGSKLMPTGKGMQERPTFIVLHGGPGFDHSGLRGFFDRFADAFQVLYLDHRGNGRSSGEQDSWYLDRWADDINDFCSALGIEKPVVLGQSFGGMVAMHYAARYPDGPAKLILSSTAAKMLHEETYRMMDRLGGEEAVRLTRELLNNPRKEIFAEFAEVCFPLYNQTPAAKDSAALRENAIRREEVGVHFFAGEAKTMNMLPELSKITCPTLVLGGAMDPITPPACSEQMAEAIGDNARLEIFDNCGHGVFRDDPEGGERIIRAFLSQ